MPRVLFVPASGTWSFDPAAPPITWNLPAAAKGGSITLTASTPGSTPTNGDGVIFTVKFDGVLAYTSACMENGTDFVAVPAGKSLIEITIARGCHGGIQTTNASASAVSDP